ncbi:MAG: 2-hydroxyglutaryl-CoA dehydratase, partial [Chrysiogenales bacterium]
MITAGCDVGSLTAKAVIVIDDTMVSSAVIKAFASPEKSAMEVMNAAAEEAGIDMNDIEYCVGTGYGRKHIG